MYRIQVKPTSSKSTVSVDVTSVTTPTVEDVVTRLYKKWKVDPSKTLLHVSSTAHPFEPLQLSHTMCPSTLYFVRRSPHLGGSSSFLSASKMKQRLLTLVGRHARRLCHVAGLHLEVGLDAALKNPTTSSADVLSFLLDCVDRFFEPSTRERLSLVLHQRVFPLVQTWLHAWTWDARIKTVLKRAHLHTLAEERSLEAATRSVLGLGHVREVCLVPPDWTGTLPVWVTLQRTLSGHCFLNAEDVSRLPSEVLEPWMDRRCRVVTAHGQILTSMTPLPFDYTGTGPIYEAQDGCLWLKKGGVSMVSSGGVPAVLASLSPLRRGDAAVDAALERDLSTCLEERFLNEFVEWLVTLERRGCLPAVSGGVPVEGFWDTSCDVLVLSEGTDGSMSLVAAERLSLGHWRLMEVIGSPPPRSFPPGVVSVTEEDAHPVGVGGAVRDPWVAAWRYVREGGPPGERSSRAWESDRRWMLDAFKQWLRDSLWASFEREHGWLASIAKGLEAQGYRVEPTDLPWDRLWPLPKQYQGRLCIYRKDLPELSGALWLQRDAYYDECGCVPLGEEPLFVSSLHHRPGTDMPLDRLPGWRRWFQQAAPRGGDVEHLPASKRATIFNGKRPRFSSEDRLPSKRPRRGVDTFSLRGYR